MPLSLLESPARSFFWTAAVADDSEMVSEDPLGLDYIAQQVGLLMLPTLTTRSTRAQAFAMVVYGLSLAERAVKEFELSPTEETRRELFERWERFWALATLESRRGDVRRGDPDAMRGVRGALKAWRPGEGPLPLDYPLISRQQELGQLGAYLSPLRRARLVEAGSVRPTLAAERIIESFWHEPDDNRHRGRYEEYAFLALEPGRTKIERKHLVTLERLGRQSRLTSLVEQERKLQQRRLYEALFGLVQDPTSHAVAKLVEAAAKKRTTKPEEVLDRAIAGDLGVVEPALRDVLVTARAYGTCMQAMIGAFDRTYAAVDEAGWIAPRTGVAAAVFGAKDLELLQSSCARLLDAPAVSAIAALPMHGKPFLRLCEDVRASDAGPTLDAMLAYHAGVQKDRRRGETWVRTEEDRLILSLTTYTARPNAPRFPSFKIHAVQSLLVDVGVLDDKDLSERATSGGDGDRDGGGDGDGDGDGGTGGAS